MINRYLFKTSSYYPSRTGTVSYGVGSCNITTNVPVMEMERLRDCKLGLLHMNSQQIVFFQRSGKIGRTIQFHDCKFSTKNAYLPASTLAISKLVTEVDTQGAQIHPNVTSKLLHSIGSI